jgi:hypothetical protein
MAVASLVSLLLILVTPHLKSYFAGNQISTGLRTITAALTTARYRAIKENRRIKFELADQAIHLKMLNANHQWIRIETFTLSDGLTLSINGIPCFYPTGGVSPLCTITISNDFYTYKVTISIAGRIKTRKIW